MEFDQLWEALRERCGSLEPDTVLVTPASERAFVVRSADEDRVTVAFTDRKGERPLWRGQFEVLHDQLAGGEGVALSGLPPGVEPYVTVLSLLPQYAVDGGRLRRATYGEDADSPFLRPEWAARRPPERIHDDAVLLADLLERYDLSAPASLPSSALVDAYVLLSDTGRGASRLRRSVGESLLEHIGPDASLHGGFGTVRRTSRRRRRLRDEGTVLSALDEAGIPHEWVLGVDREKLDVVLAVTGLEEAAVYDASEQTYVQKTAVEEGEKQRRLQGLRDRLASLEGEDAEQLRGEIERLEERIETMLAAG